MVSNTAIEWTNETWNPVTGCSVLSPGCKNCYAMRTAGTRLKHHPNYDGLTQPSKAGPVWTGEVREHEHKLDEPLHSRKPCMIFVNSMGDLFHENVRKEFIDRVFDTMEQADWHTFQVLTKRTSLMRDYVNERYGKGVAPEHIWLGTSVEDGERLSRVRVLRNTNATIRFLSIEPLIEPVDDLNLDGIHWVVVGGESGPGHRPIDPDWVRSIRKKCDAQNAAFFFKQWGGRTHNSGGRVLDGLAWNDFPLRAQRGGQPPVEDDLAPGAAGREPKETTMKAHKFAELFPPMSDASFAELVGDIRDHGLLDSIVMKDGTILDGVHRHRACLEARVKPRFSVFKGTDKEALALVAGHNLRRRHLTTKQRAQIAFSLTTMATGRPKKNASNEALFSQPEAAEMVSVSRSSVQREAKANREAAKAGKPKPGAKPRARRETAEKSRQEDARLLGKAESAFKALDRRDKRRDPSFTAEQVHFVVGLLQSFRTAVSGDTKPLPLGDELLAEARALASVLEGVEAGKAVPIRQRQREASRPPQSQRRRARPPRSMRATPV